MDPARTDTLPIAEDRTLQAPEARPDGVEQVALTPDGGALVLRPIEVARGAHLGPLAGPGGRLLGFVLAAEVRRILTLGEEGAARLLDRADSGGRTRAGHSGPLMGAGFEAGGRTSVTLEPEGAVRVPDELPEAMPAPRAWVEAAAPER